MWVISTHSLAAPKLSLSKVFHASRLERSMWNTMWWTPPKHQLLFWSSYFGFSNFFVLKKNAQSILWFPENGHLQHNFWLTKQHIASLPSTTYHSLLFDTGSTCEGDNLRKFFYHHDLVNPSKKRYPKAAHARLLDGLARPSPTWRRV